MDRFLDQIVQPFRWIFARLSKLTFIIYFTRLMISPLLFIFLTMLALWYMPQGVDMLIAVKEHPFHMLFIYLATLLWSYFTWYSSRLILIREHTNILKMMWGDKIKQYAPRLLSHSTISVMQVGLLISEGSISGSTGILFIIVQIILYLLFEFWFIRLLGEEDSTHFQLNWKLMKVYPVGLGLLSLLFLIRSVNVWILALFIAQLIFCALFISRRCLMGFKKNHLTPEQENAKVTWPKFTEIKGLNRKLLAGLLYFSNKWSQVVQIPMIGVEQKKDELKIMYRDSQHDFALFNVIGLFSLFLLCYISKHTEAARFFGPIAVMLTAFAMIVGSVNILSALSARFRFSLFFWLMVMAFIVGFSIDTHKVRLLEHPPEKINSFEKRQHFKEYLENWILNRPEIADSTVASYPVYMILSDGGASRSAYWVSSALATMEDTTNHEFSRHLLCLGGASGGSLGNAAFFALLASDPSKKMDNYNEQVKDFLSDDFLSPVLSHMLGPDLINLFFPFMGIEDRSVALEQAMENPVDKYPHISNVFSDTISDYITRQGQKDYLLPILCINTVRAQDSKPGVLSNILIDDSTFNGRVDVLSLLGSDEDMRMSSAVVLGARFPYISPAGGIHEQYFVDGGYFDNSGAGVITELLLTMEAMAANPVRYPATASAYKKLRFRVLHISNSTAETGSFVPLHPMANDLAAPVRAIVGSYGMQTTVNDERLKRYLRKLNNVHGSEWHTYNDLNLYRKNANNEVYSLNWILSQNTRNRMDRALKSAFIQEGILDMVLKDLKN